MSRTWLCQYTKVKEHHRAEGAGAPRETGWGAPSPPSFMFFSFLVVFLFLFYGCVYCGGGWGIRSAQGGPSIAPPRPALPLVKCAGRSSGKRDDLNLPPLGGSGAGPVHFCSAEKGACSSEISLPF